MKILKNLFFLLLFLAILLETVNIFFLNSVSVDSVYAAKINNETKAYEEENWSLQAEIMKYSSLAYLSNYAEKLGFTQPKEFISLSTPPLFAAKP